MSYWAIRESRTGYSEWCVHRGPRDAFDDLALNFLACARDSWGEVRATRRRIQYYSLAWIKEGECWYWSRHRRRPFRVPVGQVIATPPGLLHSYGGRGKPCREDYVTFLGPVADSFQAMGLFDPARPIITLAEPERIGEIADIVREGTLESQLRAGLLLQRILIDARYHGDHEGSRHYPAIQELLAQLAAAPERRWSNREMADTCGMSESHFRKLFRQEVGMSPNHYCERQRMGRACELLSGSHRRIGEIAAAVGYDDPLYFSKRFTAVIGVSPRSYRRSTQT